MKYLHNNYYNTHSRAIVLWEEHKPVSNRYIYSNSNNNIYTKNLLVSLKIEEFISSFDSNFVILATVIIPITLSINSIVKCQLQLLS